MTFKPYRILGVEVHPATITDLNNLVIESIEKNKKTINKFKSRK